MKKNVIALAAMLIAFPVIGGVATAEETKIQAPKSIFKLYKTKKFPISTKLRHEDVAKAGKATDFVYKGPQNAFYINGVN